MKLEAGKSYRRGDGYIGGSQVVKILSTAPLEAVWLDPPSRVFRLEPYEVDWWADGLLLSPLKSDIINEFYGS